MALVGGTIHGQIDGENVEVATALHFNKIGFLVSGETVKLKLKYYYAVCLEYEQRNGQKTEMDEESQFLHDELWGTAYIQGLYRW